MAIMRFNALRELYRRRPKEIPNEFNDVYNRWINKEISAREAGRILGVAHKTFLKWVYNHTVNNM